MSNRLTVRRVPLDYDTDYQYVTGFTEEELNELQSMTVGDQEEKILEMLDARNGMLASCWHNGYGIYGFRMLPDGCRFTVGNRCD